VQSNLENSVLELGNIEEEIANLTFYSRKDQCTRRTSSTYSQQDYCHSVIIRAVNCNFTLGMPNVRFNIQVTSAATYYNNGKDELQFLFSANKGTDFGLLKKVASGGEMSRIMLAVKLFWPDIQTTYVNFDEIDNGVSGEIAIKMGEIMKDMSTNMQIFAQRI
jgi:DNA repair protein RecN (Recombination protein N)